MFADLDETIRAILVRDVPIDPSEVDVSFDTPDREWSSRLSRPTVNCFLYDVRENLKLRNVDWQTQRGGDNQATRSRGPLRVDATYQVTAWARAREDEHRLLGRVLQALAQHGTLPSDLLQGELQQQRAPIPASVASPDHMPQNFADLWQGLDNRIRPVLTFVVTLGFDLAVVNRAPLTLKPPRIDLANLGRLAAENALRIRGRVRDRTDLSRNVPNALVLLNETGDRTLTDEDGYYTFDSAPRGLVTLVVRADGRAEVRAPVVVPAPNYDLQI
jgi:hypothetical protein